MSRQKVTPQAESAEDVESEVTGAEPQEPESPTGQGNDSVTEPEETVEPVVDETPDYEGEVRDRTAKSVLEENRRKSEEIAKLREELEQAKNLSTPKPDAQESTTKVESEPWDMMKNPPEKIKGYIDNMRDMGYDDKCIKSQIKMIGFMASEISDRKMSPAKKIIYKDNLDNSVTVLENNDKFKFAMSKYKSEFKKRMQADVTPELWGDERIAKAILGEIIADNFSDIISEQGNKKSPKELPTEPAKGGGGKAESLVSEKELIEYANEHSLDIESEEGRKRVRAAVIARKKVLNRK